MSFRSVSYTAFNIRTHPHTPARYIELLDDVFDLKRQINLRGDTYAILTSIEPINKDAPLKGLRGSLAKYTKIDDNRWLNIATLKAAEEDETKKINIPDELKPNYTHFNFVFYPENHYLIIECKDTFGTISPNLIYTYFRNILDTDTIEEKYNKVEVTLIPETDQLNSVLSLKNMHTLEIVLRRPNTDGLDDLDEDVLERLNEQNVIEERISLKAQKGLSIKADKRTIALSRVAQLNGEVTSQGTDEKGKKVELSTTKHPLKVTDKYSTKTTDKVSFLYEMGEKIVAKIREMRVGN